MLNLSFYSRNGDLQEYHGGKSEGDLVSFMLKQYVHESVEITCAKLDKKRRLNSLNVVYYGDTQLIEFNKVYKELAKHE